LRLIYKRLPVGFAIGRNLNFVSPIALGREGQLRLADGHDAFQIHAQPRVRFARIRLPGRRGIPVVGETPLWPGASLLARVGLFRPKVRAEPVVGVPVKRTYGRGFTAGVFSRDEFCSPREVI